MMVYILVAHPSRMPERIVSTLSIMVGILAILKPDFVGRLMRLTTLVADDEGKLKLRLFIIRIWGLGFAIMAFRMLLNS
jgi:hypothetical protein